jgi:hypothetical protein
VKPTDRAAWAIVAAAVLLFALSHVLPREAKPDFFTRLAAQHRERSRLEGGPEIRKPAGLPVPQRYIEATRAAVAARMAAADWPGLPRERHREILLEILILSGADAEFWSMPEARQRQVAEAYVRDFLDGTGADVGKKEDASGGQRASPFGNP